MADDICQFTELLQKFLQSDNDQRTQAEETYDGIHIVTKIQLLQQIVENQAAGPEVRTLSAVLLRRQFASSFEELWSQLDADSQLALKSRLLLNVQNEADGSLRNKLGECIAELARNLLDDDGNNSWPEVLKFLFDCASSGSAGLRESALHILTFVPGIFGNQQASYVNLIQQLFHHCLLDQESEKVRFEAVKAAVAFIVANDDDKTILAHFKSLLSPLLAVVEQSTVKQDDDSLLKCLIELAESVPKYLKSHLEEVVRFALKVMSNTEFDDNSRQLALEVIVSLSETAPGMMRKLESLVGVLIQQALAMMMEQEDDEEWSQADELDEEDNESNAVAAESALDRVACALGGKTILPLLLPLLVPMLRKADDWRSRYAALMAISACGEGCHKQMEQMLNDVVEAVLPFMADPHPRVRYASCNALGQMSTDFGPMFQKKFHQKVVSGLLSLLDDSANPRVQAHAGAALVNFCEDCPKTILGPYLDHIVAKLEQVLSSKFQELVQSGKKLVLEQIVTTLAAVADAAEDKFTQHYDRFMPVLKYIVENAVRPEHRLLRGKTIECISLVGLAVGAQKFMSDCHEVMQLLLKTQIDWDSISDDDPQISYMISAWARICKVMGPQFGQYLPLVMNPVLKAAAMKPEVTLMDNEEASSMGDDPDWQFVTVGDQKSFGIRTSGLEEKATACQMLVCYARELREPFAPYVEQVARIVVPHLKFYFHDGVRTAAAECLPPLLACANVQGAEYVNQLWQYICPELIKAIDLEPENAIRAEHMDAFAQCMVHMGKGCLTDEQIKELIAILDRLMVKHFERQEQRQEQRKDEDYDEIVEENLVDEDDEDVYMLSKVSDIIHAFFGTHKEGALPVFEQLLPHFVRLLQPDRPWADKQWSLCIFDDLVEHASPLSLNYQQYFLPHMVQYVCDEQPEVRQAAAYGVGVIAQYGGPGYAQVLNEAIPNLVKVITAPDSRVDLNLSPTENCISAIGKMCRYRSDVVNANELVPHWLSWLPVWEDEEEAMHVYNFFCDLVEGNHPAVHQNLPWVMKIIAEVLRREIFEASEDTLRRLVAIARQIQSNGELFSVCLAQLDDSQKSSLMAALAA